MAVSSAAMCTNGAGTTIAIAIAIVVTTAPFRASTRQKSGRYRRVAGGDGSESVGVASAVAAARFAATALAGHPNPR